MSAEISKAGLVRRIAAWVLDAMLLCMIAVGAICGISALMGYEEHNAVFQAVYQECETKSEEKYGISFQLSLEAYEQMTQEERDAFDAAYEAASQEAYDALVANEEAMAAFSMIVQISLTAASLGILVAVLITEFAVPLLLKNGQTLGKKAFSIGVVRNDGVKANTLQLLARALLGKYTIEIMIPVFLILMMFWGMMDMTGTIVIIGLGILQLVVCLVSKTNACIHDLLAGTVAVDLNTQRVFATTDDLINHVKRIQADRAAKQDY